MLGSNPETNAATSETNAIPDLWSDEVVSTYKSNLVIANVIKKMPWQGKKGDTPILPGSIIRKTEETPMQPVIAIVGSRKKAEPFLRAVTRWANQVDVVIPQIRAISHYEQAQGHYIAGYVMVGGMPKEDLDLLEQAVRERGMGEPVEKYDTPDSFRRAVNALRIVPSQVRASIRMTPTPTGVLNPTGA